MERSGGPSELVSRSSGRPLGIIHHRVWAQHRIQNEGHVLKSPFDRFIAKTVDGGVGGGRD